MPLATVPGGFTATVLQPTALNAALELGRPMFVVKLADQARTSSTTLVDDVELYGTVAASCTYRYELFVAYTALGGNIKIGFTFPAGGALSMFGSGYLSGSSTYQTVNIAIPSATSGSSTLAFGGGGGTIGCRMWGDLVVSGTAGTFQMQFAQNNSDAATTTVKARSSLMLTRVA